MSLKLLVRFGLPTHGWLPLMIEFDGNPIEFLISYTPNDFINDLINSLLSFLSYKGEFAAIANEEPIENKFIFDNTSDPSIFKIIQYEDVRGKENKCNVLLNYEAEPLSIVLTFWRALRKLEGQDQAGAFKDHWRRDFPTSIMQLLSKKVGMAKAKGDLH